MGKSLAEIQKAYRDRQRAEKGNEYKKKEAQRVQRYYVPTAQLSRKKLRKRRSKIKTAMRNKRARARVDAINDLNENNNNNTVNTEQETMASD